MWELFKHNIAQKDRLTFRLCRMAVIVSCVFFMWTCKKDTGVPVKTSASASFATYSGSFRVERYKIIDTSSVTYYNINTSNLSIYPNGISSTVYPIPVDTVMLNGVSMCYNLYGQSNYYIDTVGMAHSHPDTTTYPYTFTVINHSGFPSFTYKENGPYPSFSITTLPDTIYITNGITIDISGASNGDKVGVSIWYQSIAKWFVIPFPATVSFTPAELSALTASNQGYMEITVSRTVNTSVNDTPVSFQTLFVTRKYCVIK